MALPVLVGALLDTMRNRPLHRALRGPPRVPSMIDSLEVQVLYPA